MKNNNLRFKLLKFLQPSIVIFLLVGFCNGLYAQAKSDTESEDDEKYNKGVTVSPSHIEFKVDLGKIVTKKNYNHQLHRYHPKVYCEV